MKGSVSVGWLMWCGILTSTIPKPAVIAQSMYGRRGSFFLRGLVRFVYFRERGGKGTYDEGVVRVDLVVVRVWLGENIRPGWTLAYDEDERKGNTRIMDNQQDLSGFMQLRRSKNLVIE